MPITPPISTFSCGPDRAYFNVPSNTFSPVCPAGTVTRYVRVTGSVGMDVHSKTSVPVSPCVGCVPGGSLTMESKDHVAGKVSSIRSWVRASIPLSSTRIDTSIVPGEAYRSGEKLLVPVMVAGAYVPVKVAVCPSLSCLVSSEGRS